MINEQDKNGALVYKTPNKRLHSYKKLLFEPIEIHFHSDHKRMALSQEDIKKMKVKFYVALKDALEGKYPLVNQPGPDVLRVRAAITNLKPSNSAAKNSSQSLKLPLFVGQASVEAEFLDSRSQEQLAVFIDSQAGEKWGFSGVVNKWSDIDDAFKYWSYLLRDALDRAQNNGTEGKDEKESKVEALQHQPTFY